MPVSLESHETQLHQEINSQKEWIRAAQCGDKTIRNEFVEKNMGLVYHVAKRYLNRGYDLEELVQVGCIGLIKSVEKFNVEYDVCFSTYAVYLIQGEIRRFMRDDGMIKVSRSLKEKAIKINHAKTLMIQQLNREPTIEEIVEKTGLSKEDILLAMEAQIEVDSIDSELFRDGNMKKIVGEEERMEDKILDQILLKQMISKLSGNDRKIILLRYGKGWTQSTVGKKLNMSQVQISRREKKILEEMKSFFTE